MATKVFISYRREDARYQARDIHRAFCKTISSDHVFMDIDSIRPGANFRKILKGWVEECDVLLALIGPGWIDARDPKTQRRRLDSPGDFVRVEIGEALARDIPVVPVLIDDTEMPDVDLLPDDLKELVARQSEVVEFRTFEADVERLIRNLRLNQVEKPLQQRPGEPAIGPGELRGLRGTSVQRYNVLIASPSDANGNEVFRTIAAWNGSVDSVVRRVVFVPLIWEKHAFAEVEKALQAAIDEQLIDRADLFIAVFRDRLGTPTDDYPAGIIEELSRQKGRAAVFFSKTPRLDPNAPDAIEQLRNLMEFRREFKGFARTYKDDDDLAEKVRDQLDGWSRQQQNDA